MGQLVNDLDVHAINRAIHRQVRCFAAAEEGLFPAQGCSAHTGRQPRCDCVRDEFEVGIYHVVLCLLLSSGNAAQFFSCFLVFAA